MRITVGIEQEEYNRLLELDASYAALQKAYQRLAEQVTRPPIIEPSEAEKNKRELEAAMSRIRELHGHNDRLRAAVNALVECL